MTFLHALFILGSVLCAWSVLRCMGNERQRRLAELELRVRRDLTAGSPYLQSDVVVVSHDPSHMA